MPFVRTKERERETEREREREKGYRVPQRIGQETVLPIVPSHEWTNGPGKVSEYVEV